MGHHHVSDCGHCSASTHAGGELAMQLECCQTEVEFVRRRLKQTEDKLEAERLSGHQLEAKVRQDAGACTPTHPAEGAYGDGVCVCVRRWRRSRPSWSSPGGAPPN